MRRTYLLLLFVLCGVWLPAQSVLVEYLEGTVEVREDGSWHEVGIGDSIAGSATVRLGNEAIVELRVTNRTVLLARSGTYDMATVLGEAPPPNRSNVGSLIRERVRRIATDEETRDTVVAGVRASEAVDQDVMTWTGGESVDELVEEGIAALAEGAYEDAYLALLDAYDFADLSQLPTIEFYLGYVSYLDGRPGEALDFLSATAPDPAAAYYDDHVFALSQVLIDGMAYQDALDVLQAYESIGAPNEEERQMAYLLMAIATQGAGSLPAARNFLERAVAIDPDSPVGRVAAEIKDSI